MGSCVSHCSRQDVVHQQTGRVNSDHKSSEIKSGTSLLQKSLVSDDTAKIDASDVRDQINEEIRALREQLVRSQVVFSYLLKEGSDVGKGFECKSHLQTLIEEGNISEMFQCKSFDGQVPARFYNRSNRSSSSYASHRSTPMHCGYTSQSCPTLPIESPVVTIATQTEPMSGVTLFSKTGANNKLSATSSSSLNKANIFFSSPSTPCENEPLVITDICEVHREPEQHTFPRHRTRSFLSAVNDGNPKLVDATHVFSQAIMEADEAFLYDEKNLQEASKSEEDKDFYDSSKPPSSAEKCISDDNKDCVFPRKLSILLEEDFEDSSVNYFSVCSSQPFLNKKKKILSSCNVKTQTDLSISSNTPSHNETQTNKIQSENLSVKEFCLPRHGYSIVTAAIPKKTVFSEELPHKFALRHPPPYTKFRSKSSGSVSSKTFFNEYNLKPKTNMYKWATVAESLPSKSDFSQNLTKRRDSNFQTRHLSLEKQESFSSCDHSWYPDSQMSSITDCSGWMTKSEIELNARPEPPSYQQSVLASYRIQSARNRPDNLVNEKMQLNEQECLTSKPTSSEVISECKELDEKMESNKEKKLKNSQRSLRRGSGAGSPNSQLTIPRYPAFDFGEVEDAQSLFPSPSETEANQDIKAEIIEGSKSNGLKSDVEPSQVYTKSLKDDCPKKYDISKSKTLMPEVLENSETESAKGSFECEAPDLPSSVDAPPCSIVDIAFPSLPNTFLAKLGVHKDSPLPVEAFDEQELESKFLALSLAFKTDRSTLTKRLELHKRQRNIAEKNVENEFDSMREHLNTLNLKATRADVRELISKIQTHLDIAQQAAARVSGRSETYGAVQQEERVSRAFEVLVLHVDHLRRLFDKEHKELEDTKKMLNDTQTFKKDNIENVSEDQKKFMRAFGMPVKSLRKPIVQISES